MGNLNLSWLITTLNINVQNTPVIMQSLSEWIKGQDSNT